jgi:pilus assembly protein CpaC
MKRADSLRKGPRDCRRVFILVVSVIFSSALIGQTTSASTSSATPHPASFGDAVPAGEMTHLVIGHSLFVNTQVRLRRIYISNPLVLDCYTANPYQVVVTAKATGVGTVVLWDENGESQVNLISADLDLGQLRKAMKAAFPDGGIGVDGSEGRVTLSGTLPNQASADAALKLAALYAKDVASVLQIATPPMKQVSLKVRIIEVDRSKIDQFGFNLFGIGTTTGASTTGQFPALAANSTSSSSSSTSTTGSTGNTLTQSLLALTDPLNFLLYNSKIGIGATIKDLASKQLLQILAEPTITTEDGEKASFLSGGEFPFPVVQGGAGGFTSVTIQFRAYGVKLDFTPFVTSQGTIRLKVAPEVSALDYTNAVTISGYTIPAISTRRAETQVELRDGQTFAISGLLDHRTTDLLQKTPGIASVPVLGELFKSKNINHSTVELMVLVTPTLVDPVNSAMIDPNQPTEPNLPLPLLDNKQFDNKMPPSKQTPIAVPQ